MIEQTIYSAGYPRSSTHGGEVWSYASLRSQRSGAAFVQAAIHKKMRNMSVHDAMAVVGHHKGAPKELPALLQRALE
eukprot:1100418-Amphidinium_carterae.2